jgi:hypothetical protein
MNKALIILAVCIAIGVTVYLVIEFKVKKWKCTEGKCEKVIGGDYSSLEKCKNQCKVKQKYHVDHSQRRRLISDRRARAYGSGKKVTFSPDLVEYAPEPPQ